jgi:hypothetical protein
MQLNVILKSQEPMHTEILGYTQLVCGTAKIFYTSSDQTPLHQRRPEKHSLRAYMFVEDENASKRKYRGLHLLDGS